MSSSLSLLSSAMGLALLAVFLFLYGRQWLAERRIARQEAARRRAFEDRKARLEALLAERPLTSDEAAVCVGCSKDEAKKALYALVADQKAMLLGRNGVVAFACMASWSADEPA